MVCKALMLKSRGGCPKLNIIFGSPDQLIAIIEWGKDSESHQAKRTTYMMLISQEYIRLPSFLALVAFDFGQLTGKC